MLTFLVDALDFRARKSYGTMHVRQMCANHNPMILSCRWRVDSWSPIEHVRQMCANHNPMILSYR